MAAIIITLSDAARNTDLPVSTIPAATEQELDITLPAGGAAAEFEVSFTASAACAISMSPAPGVANADKHPLQTNVPFPVRIRRNPSDAPAADKVVKVYAYSTPGCKLYAWAR